METEILRTNNISNLAQDLFRIHGKCLTPIYQWDGKAEPEEYSYEWSKIPKIDSNKYNIDQQFFIEMADFLIEKLAQNCGDSNLIVMARIVGLIHGRCLAPFYEKFGELSPEYVSSYTFDKLPYVGINDDDLDQTFLLRIAEYLLDKHKGLVK